LPFKPSRLKGLSKPLMLNHYVHNYGGALRRWHAIERELAELDWTKAPIFEINGLKRDSLIAGNSVILHEAHFDVLGGAGGEPEGDLADALKEDFGGFERWRQEFVAMGRALSGGSGWVVLIWCPAQRRLVNQWASDHAHAAVGGHPILALDMYEHAYQRDFGPHAARYIDAFFANLNWSAVAKRLQAARAGLGDAPKADGVAVEDLSAAQQRSAPPLVLDVRLSDDFAEAENMIRGAEWRDPERVAEWGPKLPDGRPIVVYCAYGFEVGRGAAEALSRLGKKADYVAGGIAAWNAAGCPSMPKPESAG
jgi:Fe-Mn family superoxide dismutase